MLQHLCKISGKFRENAPLEKNASLIFHRFAILLLSNSQVLRRFSNGRDKIVHFTIKNKFKKSNFTSEFLKYI